MGILLDDAIILLKGLNKFPNKEFKTVISLGSPDFYFTYDELEKLASSIGLFFENNSNSKYPKFEDFFKIWIGDNYNTEMITVFRVMLIGWFFSSFGQIFIAKIHSEGNTKITAKIHMYEGVIYIPAMIFSILKFFYKLS